MTILSGVHFSYQFTCKLPPNTAGTVLPNKVVHELTSSLDWMPTFASLAGFALDDGKVYDGWDMSALLFTPDGQNNDAGAAKAARRDRYFYHSSEDSARCSFCCRKT
jgi:arylsulfatase A-like enzyme